MSCVRWSVELRQSERRAAFSQSRESVKKVPYAKTQGLAFLPSSSHRHLVMNESIQRLNACQQSTTQTNYQNEEQPPCQNQFFSVVIPTERIHHKCGPFVSQTHDISHWEYRKFVHRRRKCSDSEENDEKGDIGIEVVDSNCLQMIL